MRVGAPIPHKDFRAKPLGFEAAGVLKQEGPGGHGLHGLGRHDGLRVSTSGDFVIGMKVALTVSREPGSFATSLVNHWAT